MKFIILFSLLPIVASFILKKVFFIHPLSVSSKKTQISVFKICSELLPSRVIINEGKKLNLKNGVLTLPIHLYNSTNQHDHLNVLPELGLILLAKGKNTWISQQKSLLLFHIIFPSFALIILLFGALARSIPPQLCISVLFLVLGITCLNALYLTWVRHQAVQLISSAIKTVPLYLKDEETSNFTKALKAQKFKYSLPRCLSWVA